MCKSGLTPAAIAAAAGEFAARRLGTASVELLSDPANQALVVAQVRAAEDKERTQAIPDAVLKLVHRRMDAMADSLDATPPLAKALADEFLSFFLSDLVRLGHGNLGPGLRRFIDTGDLVQSVLGDLWPELQGLRFDGRDAFLALLAARLRWKAADRARGLKANKRREDLRVGILDEALVDPAVGPATELVREEEWHRTALALARLPERDRELVRAHLAGNNWADIAKAHDLQPESARKAVQRAMAKIRLMDSEK